MKITQPISPGRISCYRNKQGHSHSARADLYRKERGHLPSARGFRAILLSVSNTPPWLALQKPKEHWGKAPTIDMGDGNAGVIGILPRPGSLQGAGFLDEVRRLVRVRIWIRHQRQEDLSIEESSGKCLDSHRWDEKCP